MGDTWRKGHREFLLELASDEVQSPRVYFTEVVSRLSIVNAGALLGMTEDEPLAIHTCIFILVG